MLKRISKNTVIILCLITAIFFFIELPAQPVKAATISIINDDTNENPYDIIIRGTGLEPAPPPPPPPPAPDETITSTDPETPIETDPEGQVEHTYIITSEDEVLNITIPEGTTALDSEGNPVTLISLLPVPNPPPPPPGVNIVGPVFNLGPSGSTFSPSIEITFSYDPADIPPGVAEADLQLAFYNEATGEWMVMDCVVDTVNHIIRAQTTHFTEYAIVGQLPSAFTVSNLVISPTVAEPLQIVSISVNVTNIGGSAGDYSLILKVNDTAVDAITATLAAGVTETFTFTLTGQRAGRYTVDVNGLTGSYEVTEPPPPLTETVTTPPTTKIITQTPTDAKSLSTTIILGEPSPEDEEPLSWWLITIIVVGGLLIVLVTWRLVRRAGKAG
jgi:hypothetical protein